MHRLPAGAAAILAALAALTLARCSAPHAAPLAGFWFEPDAFAVPAGAADRLGALTSAETAAIERQSRAELERSFAGLRVAITDRRDAFWRVAVVRSLRSRGPLPNAGQSLALGMLGGTGSLAFSTLAASGVRYASADAPRQAILDGIARGIGRAAAHEFSHQMLGAAAVHSRDDFDSFEYFTSDRRSQYYGELHWTTAWPLLAKRVGLIAAPVASATTQPPGARPVPAELAAAIARAQLRGTVASWCAGRFRPGGRSEYAAAIAGERGGSYIVVDREGTAVTLAAYSGRADLSCYSPAEARRLNRTITSSGTISGRVTPRWNTTVACGFVENTSAACWQYSPTRREFVKIGDWAT